MKSCVPDPVVGRATPPRAAWSAWAVLAFVALWPLPALAEGLLGLLAIAMVCRCLWARWRGDAPVLDPAVGRLIVVFFLAYWLPEFMSAFDALDRARAWKEVAVDLRYLPFMAGVALAMADCKTRRITFNGLAGIVLFWSIDGLVQAATGVSVLFWSIDQIQQVFSGEGLCAAQEAAQADRISGMFGPCNLKLGLVLASLSPFALYAAARRGVVVWLAATVAVGVVLILAGARAAWITYALAVVVTGWSSLGWKKMLVLAMVGLAMLVFLDGVSPQVHQRVERTLHLREGGEGWDTALSGRGRIWQAALCMIRAHPINGVGARNFRFAYAECDDSEQPPAWGHGDALHAHQLILEVLSETGSLGLLCWWIAAVAGVRVWRSRSEAARRGARPAMLALSITLFPFNTHLAFYSTFWGGVLLLLAALYAGAVGARSSSEPTGQHSEAPKESLNGVNRSPDCARRADA